MAHPPVGTSITARTRTARWLLTCLAAIVVAGCGGDETTGALPTAPTTPARSALQQSTEPVGQATAGRTVFEMTCQICHKLSDSEVGAGPRLIGASLTADAIRRQIEHPRDSMPPNLVSGTDMEDVIAFVLQLK